MNIFIFTVVTQIFYPQIFMSLVNQLLTIGFLVLVVVLFVVQIIKSKPKKSKNVLMDKPKVSKMISIFGEVDNILKIERDGNRTKVALKDMEKCNLELLKEQGVKNLFVSGNNIKMICPFDTQMLIDSINQK